MYLKTYFTSTLFILVAMATTGYSGSDLESLTANRQIADFKAESVYENSDGNAVGARFRHVKSNFILDLIRIESVPQAFMWVNSSPPSDQGEPHTLEHLLLGKGNRGRYVASLEDMSLGRSSAFTQRHRTCYHFHTSAGIKVFYNLLEKKLEAMLSPTFSDEEIRREVCNLGIIEDPATGELSLEEKGTVYNEMVSSFERPYSFLYRKLGHMLYGEKHPSALSSGGLPSAIRTMTPEDIRQFHASTHHLNNMGMAVSLDDGVDLADFLQTVSEIFDRIEPDARPDKDPARALERLPSPSPAATGSISVVSFPSRNASQPGLMVFAWPANRQLDLFNNVLLNLFLSNLTDGESSILYQRFIDSQRRKMDIGASSVYSWIEDDKGLPIYLGFSNVKPEAVSEVMVDSVRSLIMNEISTIAGYADASDELNDLNRKITNLIIERRRELNRMLSTPPRFGYRGQGPTWIDHLNLAHGSDGFRKRLTFDQQFEAVKELIATGKNFWGKYIDSWGLLKDKPYGVATGPSAELLAEINSSREKRIADHVERLKGVYSVSNDQEAIKQYQQEYEKNTAIIDLAAAEIEMPGFIDNPPLTLDDNLRYDVSTLEGGGRLVTSLFDNMSGSTAGLAMSVDVIPEHMLMYLPALPSLLTDAGIKRDGETIAYDELSEILRREIRELTAYFDINYRTNRVELAIRSAGSDLGESITAIQWTQAVLFHADWSEGNIARVRDVVDLALNRSRNRMQGREESWVNDPANAFWKQTDPALLSAGSFLTKTHHLHRLRWQLKGADEKVGNKFMSFMRDLAELGVGQRESLLDVLSVLRSQTPASDSTWLEIRANLNQLPPATRDLLADAAEDIQAALAVVPDESLLHDWKYLCRQIAEDFALTPTEALANLRHAVQLLLHTDNVRSFLVTNSNDRSDLTESLGALVGLFDSAPSHRQHYADHKAIVRRLKARSGGSPTTDPTYVGLVNPNTSSGVFINTANCASLVDFNRETLLKFLSARLYGGGGAHSMFMKTWGAGLAYSNGLRSSETNGRLIYYAERCPDLAQTIQFVVNELKNAPYDPSLADYAVAQAFAVMRSGARYEQRGEAIAADLADGVTPETVKNFRQSVLKLGKESGLYDHLHNIMEATYGEVLPGYGPDLTSVDHAISFVIGPEKQMKSYEEYLKSVEKDAVLYRIYPRDFWIEAPVMNRTEVDKN